MSYRYRAYGLALESEIELQELARDDAAEGVDIRILLATVDTDGLPDERIGGRRYCAEPGSIRIDWDHVGVFALTAGREMSIQPHPGVGDDVLRLYVLGAALALLLHQRGLGVFHGSAAEIDGRGVVFLGEKGWGKSTLALALSDHGHALVSDDVTAFTWQDDQPGLLPGTPLMKLWPQTVTASGRDLNEVPSLHARVDKRALVVDTATLPFVPLSSVFVLDRGPKAEIATVEGRNAWVELMPHWFAARYGEPMLRSLGLAPQFQSCARLAQQVSVARLRRVDDLGALSDLVRLIECHVDGLTS